MNNWFKSGSPWVWLSAGGVSISLISVIGLLWLIASRGLSYFWPADIYQFEMTDEKGKNLTVIGEIYDREYKQKTKDNKAETRFARMLKFQKTLESIS